MDDDRRVPTRAAGRTEVDGRSPLDAWFLPGCAAFAWMAVAISPRSAGPLVALLAGIVSAGAAGTFALMRGRTLPRPTYAVVAIAGMPLPWLAVCTALAPQPRIALWGIFGQHAGLLACVASWSLFAAFALGAGARAGRRVLAVVASAGALASLAALADRLGLLAYADRYASAPSGIFENPITLSEGLLVAAGCAGAWTLIAREPRERAAAAGSAVLVALGLTLAASRGAFVGLAAGAVFAALALSGLVRGRRARVAGIASTGVGALLAMGSVLLLADSDSVPTALRALSTNRVDLWRSAARTAMADPLFGKGPEQFSAFWHWDVSASGALSASGAYDAHGAVLAMAAAGGLVGLAFLIASVTAVGLALAGTVRASRVSPAVVLAVAGIVAWAVSLLFAWAGVLPMLTAAIVAGSLVGAARPSEAREPGRRSAWRPVAAVATASLALAIAVWGLRPLGAEIRWIGSADSGRDRVDSAERAFADWHDPTYAFVAMSGLVDRASADPDSAVSSLSRARTLADESADAARWHVDTALAVAGVAQAQDMLAGRPAWPLFARAVAAGKEADPATGLWDYCAALEASRTGRGDLARAHARSALAFPLPESVERRMRGLVAADKPASGE